MIQPNPSRTIRNMKFSLGFGGFQNKYKYISRMALPNASKQYEVTYSMRIFLWISSVREMGVISAIMMELIYQFMSMVHYGPVKLNNTLYMSTHTRPGHGTGAAAVAAATATAAKASIQWKLFSTFNHLTTDELSEIITGDPEICKTYRDLACYDGDEEDAEGSSCAFEGSKGHYQRFATVNENVHDRRRFLCDKPSKGKVGVIVYSKKYSHIMLVRSYNGPWGVPKGTFDISDTDARFGGRRELLEETGSWAEETPLYRIVPAGTKLVKGEFYQIHTTSKGESIFMFYCVVDMNTIPKLEDLIDVDYEITEIAWFKLRELPSKMNKFTYDVRSLAVSKAIVSDSGMILPF